MNKFDKEDRNIVILIIIFLLLLSILLICNLLKNKEEVKVENTVVENYELLFESNSFKSYRLNNSIIDNFRLYIHDVNITFNNNELIIDDQNVIDSITLNDVIGVYDNTLVLTAIDMDNKSLLIKYNRIKREYKILYMIDDMYLYDIHDISMAEAGLFLKLTRRSNNNIVVNNKEYDICSYKDDKLIESMEILYVYDIDIDDFKSYDILSKKTVYDIKKGIC